MDTSRVLSLGVFEAVSNTEREYELEAKTLHVGFLKVGGRVRPLAFTIQELTRPLTRAEKNLEDLPTLEICDEVRIQSLSEQLESAKAKIEKLNKRGLLARLLNLQPG